MTFKIRILRAVFYASLFIPLFFINIRKTHDWGDDFAQYIHQAGNIVEGKSQADTRYIFNPDQPFVGPPVYPIGYPLLLASAYRIWGNQIKKFDYFNTLLLCLFGICIIYFLKSLVGELIAVLLAIIIIYNPWTLSFKAEVLADISFSLFLLCAVIIYLNFCKRRTTILTWIACGFLTGFLILIKNTGMVLLAAIMMDSFINVIHYFMQRKFKEIKLLTINTGALVICAMLVIAFFNYVLFHTRDVTFQYFKSLYTYDGIKEVLLQNIAYYIMKLQDFFHPQVQLWECLPLIAMAFVLTFFILGLINEIIKKITFLELIITGYLLMICIFPNATQGFRYLFPVIPIIMYYVVKGMLSFQLNRKINIHVIAILISAICVSYYRTGITQITKEQSSILIGPQEPEAIEAFNYIKLNTKPNDTIVFSKPRALALYTGRYSFTNHPRQDSLSLEKKFAELPGSAACYLPAPPQTRASGFPAHGSSENGFAKLFCDISLEEEVVSSH